jgi:1,2-diacylglycerol 3-beta-galactosyltransferase
MTKPLRFLLYYADTGGGHRATAMAIAQGLKQRYGDAVDPVLLDGLRKYLPYPLNRLDDMYPWMSGMSKSWGRGWTQSNDPQRVQRFMKLWWPYIRTACMRMAKEPCDAVINVQPLYTYPVLWAMDRIGVRKPFVTMVSDLIVVHAAWCEPTADRLLVPTEVSRLHALEHHMPPEKIQIVGLPIRLLFMNPPEPKPLVRQRLGLTNKFTVLLMGGGQGLGRVYEIAEAIGHSGLNVQLIVVAGRNKKLKEQLDDTHWPIELHPYGFTQDIPALMDAADVLITKAGPTTICEAFTRRLPIIISGYIPSQENENADYVVNNRAGVLAEEPELIVATLREWMHNPSLLTLLSDNSARLAHPRAAIEAAEAAYEVATTHPIVYRAPQGDPLLARIDRLFGT